MRQILGKCLFLTADSRRGNILRDEDPGRNLLYMFVVHDTINAVIKYRVPRILLRLNTTTLITVLQYVYVLMRVLSSRKGVII